MARPDDPGIWMWTQACELLDQAERMHRQFFRPEAAARAFSVWQPPVDLFEDDAGVVLVAAMPGVDAGEVDVCCDGAHLIVRGKRALPLPRGGARVHVRRLEIPYGRFERRVELPPGRYRADAPELQQGLLVVRLRRVER